MVSAAESQPTSDHYDLVILGGAFSGSSLGLLMRRQRPGTRILILEKSEKFDRKVGESTSEVAGCFLTRVLGLSSYLAREHFQKNGLRLWFNKEGNDCPSACSEIGPFTQARFPTYQLDRSKLDTHLLGMADEEGCDVIRTASVKTFELDGAGKNTVTFKHDGMTRTVTADWIADCSGKAALIGRIRGTLRPLDGHPVHSMWVRFRNVTDLDSYKARMACEALDEMKTPVGRTSATNHLMGRGWWSWIIPLANGEFSAGVTWDERLFTPPAEGPVGQRVKQHLLTHPIGKLMFGDAEPVENDSRIYKNLPYYSTEVCGDGWMCMGDAAGFMDPLYSQGLDYCAHSTYTSASILRMAMDGEDVSERLERHNHEFGQSYHRWFNALYRNKYQYLGDSDMMRAAFLMDIATYFLGPVQLVYNWTDQEFSKMPYHGVPGGIFGRFMAFYNKRLEQIARKRLKTGRYGVNNLHHPYLIKTPFVASVKASGHLFRGLFAWLKLELETAFVRPEEPVPAPRDHATTPRPLAEATSS
ncbi:NAD(P)/FAD-dependent oxidoreductase [Haloferula rosea]|uniref:NAD(P)/FAD-dependent oxidoreductase n=1 Tax=Haloferula rosea TaxID=490093 RepID=A0A934VH81_9BACT|nr:NAD(P)/FAD-dependent oxidoreductase [Haloferula rosea]MBK1828797.1 NAD(P)/FAD-dependent oxidoreductase [Haloferula rosea]